MLFKVTNQLGGNELGILLFTMAVLLGLSVVSVRMGTFPPSDSYMVKVTNSVSRLKMLERLTFSSVLSRVRHKYNTRLVNKGIDNFQGMLLTVSLVSDIYDAESVYTKYRDTVVWITSGASQHHCLSLFKQYDVEMSNISRMGRNLVRNKATLTLDAESLQVLVVGKLEMFDKVRIGIKQL